MEASTNVNSAVFLFYSAFCVKLQLFIGRPQATLTTSSLLKQREGGNKNCQTFTSLAELDALAKSLQALKKAPEVSERVARFTDLLVFE